MNRLYLSLSVLCISVHVTGWAMLTISNATGLCPKKLFTKEFVCKHECLALKNSQKFLASFMQKDFNEIGDEFCALPRAGKARVMRCLDNDQKLLLRIAKHKGVDHYILTELFNGCEKVATMYSEKPIGEILEAYASAKEMMKWCPIFKKNGVVGVLKEHHYMALKSSQRIFLADIDQKATIPSVNVPQFMSVLNMLHDIDPEFMDIGNIQGITNTVKLDLSLSERAWIFYDMIPNGSFKRGFLMSLVYAAIGAPTLLGGTETLDNYTSKLEGLGCAVTIIMPVAMTGFWLGTLPATYFLRYRDHLKTNILPSQPTLTEYLKKIAS